MSANQDLINLLLSDPEFVRWVKNSDPELDRYWKNWMASHPEKVNDVKQARELIIGLGIYQFQTNEEDKKVVLQKILAKDNRKAIDKNDLDFKLINLKQNHVLWSRLGQWTKVAVILVVVVVASLIYHKSVPTSSIAIPVTPTPTQLITKTTNPGEKLNLKLADGTSVFLNSGSELIFPEKFDSLERVVELIGEGFFEVYLDTLRPFKVISGAFTTEALGTSFNINNLDGDRLSISLVTGKVKIKGVALADEIFLEPGLQLNFNSTNQKTLLRNFSIEEVTAWKDGELRFSNASFGEVIQKLERWYGVNMEVSGRPSENWQLTGNYKNQTLDLVLERMAYIESFQYSLNNKNVQLKF